MIHINAAASVAAAHTIALASRFTVEFIGETIFGKADQPTKFTVRISTGTMFGKSTFLNSKFQTLEQTNIISFWKADQPREVAVGILTVNFVGQSTFQLPL